MKKIILLLTLLVGLSFGLTTKTIASTNVKAEHLYKDYIVKPNSSIILTQGYYVIYAEFVLNEHYGDGFLFFLEDPVVSGEAFRDEIDVESTYTSLIDEMCETADHYCQANFDRYVIGFLKVKSAYAISSIYNSPINIFAVRTNPTQEIKSHVVNIDSPTSLDTIKARYSATDNVDGNLNLKFYSNYNPANIDIGNYYIVAEAKDSAGLTTYAVNYIRVQDFEKPVVSLKESSKEFEVNSTIDIEDLKSNFIVTDNYNGEITVEYSTNYNGNNSILTNYNLTCKATDLSGNTSDLAIFTIKIVDTTKPQISLKDGGDTILANEELTTDQIYELLLVTDNYTTMTKSNVNITTNCQGEEGVEYQITVVATDSSNNSTTAYFKYKLKDTTYPIITVKDTIYLQSGKTYTTNEILQLLKESGIISSDATEINIISYNLISEDEASSTYNLTIEHKNQNGEVNYSQIKMVFPKEKTTFNYFPIIIGCSFIIVTLIGYKLKKRHEKN